MSSSTRGWPLTAKPISQSLRCVRSNSSIEQPPKKSTFINLLTFFLSFFQTMVIEITEVYTDMVNCSLFVDAYDSLSKPQQSRLGEWTPFDDPLLETSGDWLPHIVRLIRWVSHWPKKTVYYPWTCSDSFFVFFAHAVCLLAGSVWAHCRSSPCQIRR